MAAVVVVVVVVVSANERGDGDRDGRNVCGDGVCGRPNV